MTEDKFDMVLTNPPFGAVIRRTEKGDGYLEQYDLRRYLNKNNYPGRKEITGEDVPAGAKSGRSAVRERASVKTEILFLERIHSFLKPGSGRAAVVLPDGILTNSSLEGVRHWILERFQLLAVVSLPQFAFAHYDAGVKASIVFLRRLDDGEGRAGRRTDIHGDGGQHRLRCHGALDFLRNGRERDPAQGEGRTA